MATFVFNPTELAYLAALQGARALIGTPDPFEGKLADQVEAALAQARQNLLSRGLLTEAAGAAPVIRPDLARPVGICAAPELVFTVNRTVSGGQTLSVSFQISGTAAVEQLTDYSGALTELRELDSCSDVSRRLTEMLQIPPDAPAAAGGGRLTEAVLAQARRQAAEGDRSAALAQLAQAACPTEVREALADTLVAPLLSGAVARLTREAGGWTARGFGILLGGAGLWQLSPITTRGTPWVELTPVSGRELTAAIIRMTDHTRTLVAAG